MTRRAEFVILCYRIIRLKVFFGTRSMQHILKFTQATNSAGTNSACKELGRNELGLYELGRNKLGL